ncbi:MAG: hypothetical protein ACREDR_14955, partial [Blastocatellia bacterium]
DPNAGMGAASRWAEFSSLSAETIKRPLGETAPSRFPSSFDKSTTLSENSAFGGWVYLNL